MSAANSGSVSHNRLLTKHVIVMIINVDICGCIIVTIIEVDTWVCIIVKICV